MIKGKLVDLRLIEEKDIDLIYRTRNDLEQQGEFVGLSLKSLAKFKKQFAETGFWENDSGDLLIIDKKNDAPVGICCFYKGCIYLEGYEIGYIIYNKKDRGKGFTSEAVNLFVSFLFDSKPISRLYANVTAGNEASHRVLEKCGFKRDGVMRKAIFNRGKTCDLWCYSLLREEFKL